jgi:hypothetical protein
MKDRGLGQREPGGTSHNPCAARPTATTFRDETSLPLSVWRAPQD